MASQKKYSTFDKQNRGMAKAKPLAPAPVKGMPSKSMTAAAPRTKKSAEKMAAEKAARKIVAKELKPGTSYGTAKKKFETLAGRMTTERSRTATRAKATSARDAAKEKIQKLDKKKVVFKKLGLDEKYSTKRK